MIIRNVETLAEAAAAAADAADAGIALAEGRMVGDPTELAEMAVDLLTETHNLTVAMARFEHAQYVAEYTEYKTVAHPELKPSMAAHGQATADAAGEFFKRIGEKIVKFWNTFIAWLRHAVAWIGEKVFGPRKIWLDKNKAALMAKDGFGGAKAEFGREIDPSELAQMPGRAIAVAKETADAAAKAEGGEAEGGSLGEKIKAPFKAWVGAREDGKSVTKAVEEKYIGESEEQAITQALVHKMVAAAETAFANVAKLKEAEGVAKGFISEVQAMVAGAGDEQKKGAALRHLSTASTQISQFLGASVAANSKACAQAMSVLVKAMGAKDEAASAPTPAQAALKRSASLNSSTSILDAYMP